MLPKLICGRPRTGVKCVDILCMMIVLGRKGPPCAHGISSFPQTFCFVPYNSCFMPRSDCYQGMTAVGVHICSLSAQCIYNVFLPRAVCMYVMCFDVWLLEYLGYDVQQKTSRHPLILLLLSDKEWNSDNVLRWCDDDNDYDNDERSRDRGTERES